jgi:tRNA pseudouridine65 synthase
VVVAKPPRLLVHRAPRAPAEHHALQIVRDMLGCRVHPVHRLDRPTSGCLVFALRREAIAPLQQALAAPDARKTYLAFVRGRWTRERSVTVDLPMKDDGGVLREAVSEVECLATCPDPRSSLLRIRPHTGRTHQVRRHARDLDHPVLGDGAHGDTRENRWWREHHGLRRLGLHCLSLDLPLPGGERLVATCPVYEDLLAIWQVLPWWEAALAAEPALALPALAVPRYLAGDGDPGSHPADPQ